MRSPKGVKFPITEPLISRNLAHRKDYLIKNSTDLELEWRLTSKSVEFPKERPGWMRTRGWNTGSSFKDTVLTVSVRINRPGGVERLHPKALR